MRLNQSKLTCLVDVAGMYCDRESFKMTPLYFGSNDVRCIIHVAVGLGKYHVRPMNLTI